MAPAAPTIDSRLLAALPRIDAEGRPFAETNRRIGLLAETIGLPRPSYEQVRVHLHRARRKGRQPGPGQILLDIALRVRPPEDLYEVFGA